MQPEVSPQPQGLIDTLMSSGLHCGVDKERRGSLVWMLGFGDDLSGLRVFDEADRIKIVHRRASDD